MNNKNTNNSEEKATKTMYVGRNDDRTVYLWLVRESGHTEIYDAAQDSAGTRYWDGGTVICVQLLGRLMLEVEDGQSRVIEWPKGTIPTVADVEAYLEYKKE